MKHHIRELEKRKRTGITDVVY